MKPKKTPSSCTRPVRVQPSRDVLLLEGLPTISPSLHPHAPPTTDETYKDNDEHIVHRIVCLRHRHRRRMGCTPTNCAMEGNERISLGMLDPRNAGTVRAEMASKEAVAEVIASLRNLIGTDSDNTSTTSGSLLTPTTPQPQPPPAPSPPLSLPTILTTTTTTQAPPPMLLWCEESFEVVRVADSRELQVPLHNDQTWLERWLTPLTPDS